MYPQTDLEEERIKQKIAGRTTKEKCRIYLLRVILNVFVVGVLAACFYSIYVATIFSQEAQMKSIKCWETRVGQEMYKLSIFDFIIIVSVTIFVEFPRNINCSQACGPFVNYNTSWQVLPATISQMPEGAQILLFALSSEAFAVSFFVVTCMAMFYVIALAGAHKRVISQLREQLVIVSILDNYCQLISFVLQSVIFGPFCFTGGPGQALPDPEAVPGSEVLAGSSDDVVVACGGFVKSDVEINYSLIEALCMYMTVSLAVGSWCLLSTEPTSVDLHVDGVSDVCTKEEDINFVFTGFSVSGMKSCRINELKDFIFFFLVNAGTPSSKCCLEVMISQPPIPLGLWRSKTAVLVSNANALATEHLVVGGYDVSGEVRSDGEPMKEVTFLLYSATVTRESLFSTDIYECQYCAKASTVMLFLLLCVQPIFRVMGFSVTGRVLNSADGEGVPDATVSLNNQIKGKH
ncbi:hypothetical protein XENOCAPTIV_026586, partial [Xenoophorus captivus]